MKCDMKLEFFLVWAQNKAHYTSNEASLFSYSQAPSKQTCSFIKFGV